MRAAEDWDRWGRSSAAGRKATALPGMSEFVQLQLPAACRLYCLFAPSDARLSDRDGCRARMECWSDREEGGRWATTCALPAATARLDITVTCGEQTLRIIDSTYL